MAVLTNFDISVFPELATAYSPWIGEGGSLIPLTLMYF